MKLPLLLSAGALLTSSLSISAQTDCTVPGALNGLTVVYSTQTTIGNNTNNGNALFVGALYTAQYGETGTVFSEADTPDIASKSEYSYETHGNVGIVKGNTTFENGDTRQTTTTLTCRNNTSGVYSTTPSASSGGSSTTGRYVIQ